MDGPACLHYKKWGTLPTHEHQRDWAEKNVYQLGQILPSLLCFLVMCGSLATSFIICEQMVKLKPISCLLT